MATFKLTNINLQINNKIFSFHSKKILKVEFVDPTTHKPSLLKLKQPAQVLSDCSLAWSQTLILPAVFSRPYPFEIITTHGQHFNYNPESLDGVIDGAIVIKKDQGNYTGWQVKMDGNKIGYLFANVEFYGKGGIKKELNVVENNSSFFGNSFKVSKDSIAVTSIYATFPLLNSATKIRVYLQFQLNGTAERSAIKRLHQNQYRSYEHMQLKHTDLNDCKLTVSGVIFDSTMNSTKIIGRGCTNLLMGNYNDSSSSPLSERVKVERIYLNDQNSEEVGLVSFKYIKTRDESLDPRFFLQDKFSTIGDINFKPLSYSSLGISQVRAGLAMSPHQTNNRIFMPKSERFEDPAKRKKNDRIGLAHMSIDLKDLPSTKRYQVTSLGYGKKHAPVQRDREVPGVGSYQLPILFDRFK